MDGTFISRRSTLKGLGSAVATGALLSSTAAGKSSGDGTVSKQDARQIARAAADEIGDSSEYSDWSKDGVRAPKLFHAKVRDGDGVSYVPRAWVFPVEDGGSDVGHITIDADQFEVPVLSFGRGKAPQRRLTAAKKVAKAYGSPVHDRFLYHGGVTYGVESADDMIVDLRGQVMRGLRPAESADSMKPTHDRNGNKKDSYTTAATGDKLTHGDWSGETDDEVSNVPNWTETDSGGASSTSYGTGDDSWNDWDGCTPVAASMAIGYHEGIDEWDDNDREALIDRLHDDMDTSDDGVTKEWNSATGIDNYSEGSHSYNGNNNQFNLKGNIRDGIGNDNPTLLNMTNGPYTKDAQWVNGHTVCVVGYRDGNGFYHKVHQGYDDPPDRVANGNWTHAWVTRISKQ